MDEHWSVGSSGGVGWEWWSLLWAVVCSLVGLVAGLWEWRAAGAEGGLGRRAREHLLVLGQSTARLRDRLLPFVLQGQTVPAEPVPPSLRPAPTAPSLRADQTPASSQPSVPAAAGSQPDGETPPTAPSEPATAATAPASRPGPEEELTQSHSAVLSGREAAAESEPPRPAEEKPTSRASSGRREASSRSSVLSRTTQSSSPD